jgi:non-heme chloroperoxidase
MRFIAGILAAVLVCVASATSVVQNAPNLDKALVWHDPSPHTVQFIGVDKDVKLEVLDWGGSGRPVVLLSGLGDTAHVFDDFAPKLTSQYHVYGITRRGFGASSGPVPVNENYSADRLGDDVLAVLDALRLERPVLVGHSIAGEELSSVGTRHPERVAGLIYLDAGNGYAFYDRARGYFSIDLDELQRKLQRLQENPPDPRPLMQDLSENELPVFERDLQERQKNYGPHWAPNPSPSPADLVSFPAYTAWIKRAYGLPDPEAELRQEFESNPDGSLGKPTTPESVLQAVRAGERKYTNISVPILDIYVAPHDLSPIFKDDRAALAAAEARDVADAVPQAKAFESGVPSAHMVRLVHASHYVFMSNEADVLREMRAFIGSLP